MFREALGWLFSQPILAFMPRAQGGVIGCMCKGEVQGSVQFPWGELLEFIALSSFLLKLVFELCLQT